MKKQLALLLTLLGSSLAHAGAPFFHTQNMDPLALLNWKVGDSSDYTLSMAFGQGKMHKEVTGEEGNSVWLTEKVNLMGQKDVSEVLFDRDTGKIIQMRHNGQPETPPNEQPEIISQEYEEVTVPAGTFKSIHVTARTKSISNIEIWANTKDVVIDGAIKEILSTQFGDITLELTQQNRAN